MFVNGLVCNIFIWIWLRYMNTYFQSFPSDLLNSEFCRCGCCLDMTCRAAWAHTMNAFIGRLICSFLRSDEVLKEENRKQNWSINMVFLVFFFFFFNVIILYFCLCLVMFEQSHNFDWGVSSCMCARYQRGYAGALRQKQKLVQYLLVTIFLKFNVIKKVIYESM